MYKKNSAATLGNLPSLGRPPIPAFFSVFFLEAAGRIRPFYGVRYGGVPAKRVGGVWSWPPEAACSTGGGVWSIAGAGSSGGDHGGGGAGGDRARARARTGRARACARACAGTQGPGGLCGHALRGEHDCRRVTSRRLHRANPCRTTGRPNTTVTVRARVVGWGVGGYGPAGQRRRPVRVGGYGRGARAPTLPYLTPQKVRIQDPRSRGRKKIQMNSIQIICDHRLRTRPRRAMSQGKRQQERERREWEECEVA